MDKGTCEGRVEGQSPEKLPCLGVRGRAARRGEEEGAGERNRPGEGGVLAPREVSVLRMRKWSNAAR